jgi:pimeloyl-ACP methyl ester carboxylesterase
MSSVRVNGIDLAYRHWPAPNQAIYPPLVLLHGTLQTGEGMRHLAEKLAQHGEVIVPDLRGRGATSQPLEGYDPASMAEDVGELVDYLDVEPVVAIGRLHGGLVSYHLAARRPELVRAIVLGDATPEVSEERAEAIKARVEGLPSHFQTLSEAESFYQNDLGLSPARVKSDLPSDLVQAADGTYQWRHNLEIVSRIEAASMPRSDWHVLDNVRCPVLILRGQRGLLRQEIMERMVGTMDNARGQTILGAGYDVFLGPGSEQTLAAIQLFLHGQLVKA